MPQDQSKTSSTLTPMDNTMRPDKTPEPYLSAFLKLIPLLEILLAGIGLYYLGFTGGGILGWLKLIVFCAAAYTVAYAIYRMAIEKGVPLVAARSKLAAPLSGLTIFLVGAAFFAVTAPGLTISAVEEMRLTDHVEALGVYVNERLSAADQRAELIPIMQSMADDLRARMEQESTTGFGPIAQALNALHVRTSGLATQVAASQETRAALLAQIEEQRQAMDATLADETASVWTRRARLRAGQAQLMSLLAALDQAVPVSIVNSYVSELESGVLIPRRQDAAATINQTLNGYAQTLVAALDAQESAQRLPPAFPPKTGALDTFRYAGAFAPVFLFAWLVDMGFPLTLWAYVLMTVVAHSPQTWKRPRQSTDFDHLTRLRAIDMTPFQDEPDSMEPQSTEASHQKANGAKPPSTRGGHRSNGKARR